MKFVLTKIPITEDIFVEDFQLYLKEVRFGEQYPNDKTINISNDHPFEKILNNGGEITPYIFPALSIIASNDGEASAMPKAWAETKLVAGDLDGVAGDDWYVAESALADMRTIIAQDGQLFGVQHSAKWRDNISFEIWAENIKVKNDIYNFVMGYLTGPKIMAMKVNHGIIVHSNTIQGQRSGYYNFDFGRPLYGGRISLQADYDILQAVYDGDAKSFADIKHSYMEVING